MNLEKLSAEIATTLARASTSAVIKEVLEKVCIARERLDNELAAYVSRSLSPALSHAEAHAARDAGEQTKFEVARLEAAQVQLQQALKKAVANEAEQERQAAFEEVIAEREALVVEIAERYPVLAAELGDLIRRLSENDAKIMQMGNALTSAECEARSCAPNFLVRGELVPRITGIILPCLTAEYRAQVPGWAYHWHPRTEHMLRG